MENSRQESEGIAYMSNQEYYCPYCTARVTLFSASGNGKAKCENCKREFESTAVMCRFNLPKGGEKEVVSRFLSNCIK